MYQASSRTVQNSKRKIFWTTTSLAAEDSLVDNKLIDKHNTEELMVPVTSWDSNQNLFAISHSLTYNSKMATTTLSHHLLCLYSSSFSSKQFNSSRSRNFTYSVRYKTVLKSSLHEKNTTTTATSLKTPPQKQIPKVIDKPDPKRLTPSDSFSVFFSSLR